MDLPSAQEMANAEPADRYVVTVHSTSGRPRRREGVRGTICFSFLASKRLSDEIRSSLQVHSPSLQRGRAVLWANNECLTPSRVTSAETTEVAFPDDDESVMLAEHLRDRRELLGMLKAEHAALAAQRDQLAGEVTRLREERNREIERQKQVLSTVTEHTDAAVRRAQEAGDAQLERYTRTQEEATSRYTALLKGLAEQADAVVETRQRLGRLMRRDLVEESLTLAREMGRALLESPVGDAVSFSLAGLVAERKAAKTGNEVTGRDAQAAMMLNGKAFRGRLQVLKTWCAQGERPHVVVGVAIEYLLGGLPLEALEFALANGARPPT